MCVQSKVLVFQTIGLVPFIFKMLAFVVVMLVFYDPSTHFMSFRARSVNLFLGTPPRRFTSTQCRFFRQSLTTAFLESLEG